MKPQSLTALKAGARLAARLPCAGAQRFGHYMGAMFSPYDFRGIRITAPTSGFCGERQLRLNGVDLIVREVGPAHTDGDAYVYLPDRQVAYAGDILFVGVTPVMWAGPVENLLAGLKQLRALDARVIVPGHGPLATRADVQNVIDYWEFIQEELDRRRQQGMAPDQAARDLALSPRFQAMPFAQWDSPERIVTNAYTLYRHWGADTGALPGNLGIMDVLRRQAALAFALPQATPRAMRSRVPLRH
jgi:glyoxylase-like metal-dependent hydrolase (beta-lactamase superfamily II)